MPVEPAEGARAPLRQIAVLEVLTVCGFPTQAAISALLWLTGLPMSDEHGLSLTFFATLSFLDTILVLWLISRFLARTRETPAAVFVGTRPVAGEMARGLALVPLVILGVGALVLAIRQVAPWLQTVERNPFEDFIRTPINAAIFLVVVVIAGGVREEMQRAFILHRFEQSLGGARLGLIIFSLVFGLLHWVQGIDVAVVIGVLGFVWGVIFLRRRSAVLPMTNHAAFNAIQVVQVSVARSLGM